MKKILFVSLLFSLFACKTKTENHFIELTDIKIKKIPLTEEEKMNWFSKDIIKDTIPGISLEKAYNEIIKNKQGKEVIIAVIDTKLDIKHKGIQKNIWKNFKEIPNNNIDDDRNGYVDDINGWNFLGNKSGQEVFYSNFESVRIIRKYDSIFKFKSPEEVDKNLKLKYSIYKKAQKNREIELNKLNKDEAYSIYLENTYPKSKEILKKFFPKENYTIHQLDSMYNVYQNDSVVGPLIYYMADYKKYKLSEAWIKNYKKAVNQKLITSLNFDYNERDLIGDNSESKVYDGYGNNKVWNDSIPFQHAIKVSGVLAANSNRNVNYKGIVPNSKLMSLCVVSSGGDEHDKDIALAIRYAADNGAKIINISFGKPLSMNKKWVDDAILHAYSKDVLIICSAGNDGKEIDLEEMHYPNDHTETGKEISDNLLKVGAVTYHLDKKLKAYFSNYSKDYIDLFAPGYEIHTTIYNNEYGYISGTSLSAPIVSGVAALIRSYYPDLTAPQVKDILMKSGVSYNIDVEIKLEDGTKKMVPFSELSKSGKVVNAYNALLMAGQVSKQQ